MFWEKYLIKKRGEVQDFDSNDRSRKVIQAPKSSERKRDKDNAGMMRAGLSGFITNDIDVIEDKLGKAEAPKQENAGKQAEKKEAISDKLKDPIDFVDSKTGYRIRIYTGEAGFDGSLDVYFPGDGASIRSAESDRYGLIEGLKAKLKSGKNSALVIVEGKRAAIRGEEGTENDKKTRYHGLRRVGAFSGIMEGVSSKLGGVKNINLVAHSRGGSAISYVLKSGNMEGRITSVSCLDSTLFSSNVSKLVNFVQGGGKLRAAFSHRGQFVAKKIISRLGLKNEPGNRWVSEDGKVEFIYDNSAGHSGVVKKYAGTFMMDSSVSDGVGLKPMMVEKPEGEKGEIVSGGTSILQSKPDSEVEALSESGEGRGGENFEEYLKKLEEYKKDPKKLDILLKWVSKQKDVRVLRHADVILGSGMKDEYLKYLKLAAVFLKRVNDIDGHKTFKVDFQGIRLAESKVGAGHMLPVTGKEVCIRNRHGRIVSRRAERKVRRIGGREKVGYYDVKTGKYAYVHTGYTIEILEEREFPEKEGDDGYKELQQERKVFDDLSKKLVIGDRFQKYVKDVLKMDLGVDQRFLDANLGKIGKVFDEKLGDWWNGYVEGDINEGDFNKIFNVFFADKLVLYRNVMELARLYGVTNMKNLSDLDSISSHKKLKELNGKVFSPQDLTEFALRNFQEKELKEILEGGKDLIKMVREAALYARVNHSKDFIPHHCEHFVDWVVTSLREAKRGLKPGSLRKVLSRWTKVDKKATVALRAKPIAKLTMEDFRGLKPGLSIYAANKEKYAEKGVEIKKGTSKKLPVINNTDRHWFLWNGVGFTDNRGLNHDLTFLKQHYKWRNRVIVNVHDAT